MLKRIELVLILLLGAGAASAQPLDPLVEYRYTGQAPARDETGRIARRMDVLAAYRRLHPCPATGRTGGACPGWAINHVVPLACGGADAVYNLMWMRNDVKRLVDSYERKISASTPPAPDTGACVNVFPQ